MARNWLHSKLEGLIGEDDDHHSWHHPHFQFKCRHLKKNSWGISKAGANTAQAGSRSVDPAEISAAKADDELGPTSRTIFVAENGSGNFTTIQAAIDSIPRPNSSPVTILLTPGTYKEKVILRKGQNYVTIKGKSAEDTIVTFDNYAGQDAPDGSKRFTTWDSPSFAVEADDFVAQNITFRNTAGSDAGSATAVRGSGTHLAFHFCSFDGWQNTLNAHAGVHLYNQCEIQGSQDFIFGGATAYFLQCKIHGKTAKGSVVAQSRNSPTCPSGYVFWRCEIGGEKPSLLLARPWLPFARVVFMECTMNENLAKEGYDNWNDPAAEATSLFAEYKCTGPGADPSGRAPFSRQLSNDEAEGFAITNFLEVPFMADRFYLEQVEAALTTDVPQEIQIRSRSGTPQGSPRGMRYRTHGNRILSQWYKPGWSTSEEAIKSYADAMVGYGANKGGQAGPIVQVTSNADDGPGSLRGVLQAATGPVWITFASSMTITLKSSLDIPSNVTIDGRGVRVECIGGQFSLQKVSNVIISTLIIHDVDPKPLGNAVYMSDAKFVVLDHLQLYRCKGRFLQNQWQGKLVDCHSLCTDITVTNCSFADQYFNCLLGAGDDQDNTALRVTFAYNYFAPTCHQRMPRCREGVFHVVNNLYDGFQFYAIGGSDSPRVLSESNLFRPAPELKGHGRITVNEWKTELPTWNDDIACARDVGSIFQDGTYFEAVGKGIMPAIPYNQGFKISADRLARAMRNAGWFAVAKP